MIKHRTGIILIVSCLQLVAGAVWAQKRSVSSGQKVQKGYKLVWADEFNRAGAPDSANWNYETGLERNEELQWYQKENAWCENGKLVIEARRELRPNPLYKAGSTGWRTKRDSIHYTSSCIKTRNKQSWLYGRFIMRGKIDIRDGLWPAWWTLGAHRPWPANGEIDIMEYYRHKLLANIAHKGADGKARWFSTISDIDSLGGARWAAQFHIWRMDWDEEGIALYADDQLLLQTPMDSLVNQDGSGENPFKQPHYMLLDFAIGGQQGGDPSKTTFPARFEVDYVRVYQKSNGVR
ncbi:glycoside hydrolase family 16 protein [Niabella hirudinis]|uniref:glycoside hydrolase family 16 protein n=1 Tax=Niabella hirudinis TaxID=1285929 RepID=UPI003EBE25F8